jgi:hypothetical protein
MKLIFTSLITLTFLTLQVLSTPSPHTDSSSGDASDPKAKTSAPAERGSEEHHQLTPAELKEWKKEYTKVQRESKAAQKEAQKEADAKKKDDDDAKRKASGFV